MIIAVPGMLIISCNKDQPVIVNSNTIETRLIKGGGRKDNNGGILMHKTINQNSQALEGIEVFILCNSNADTLSLYSDAAGECAFYLENLNPIRVVINAAGFQPVDSTYNLTDSVNIKTTVLKPL